MLAAANRMRRGRDFIATTRGGTRRARGAVVVHLNDAHQGEPALVGFVVPRSVGGAVQRNLVKRRLRAIMRERVATLEGRRVVVRALGGAAEVPFERLRSDAISALDSCLHGGRR